MRGGVCPFPADRADVAFGSVQGHHDGGWAGPFPKSVEAPAVDVGSPVRVDGLERNLEVVGASSRPTDFFVKETGLSQKAVANHFRRQTVGGRPAEEKVFGIFFLGFREDPAFLPVGMREDHGLEQTAQVPARVHEVAGQPIQEPGMGWWLALHSEIFGGGNQPASKDHLPVAVHRYAGQKRVVRRGEPLGQAEPVFRGALGEGRKNLRRRSLHDFAPFRVESSFKDMRFAQAWHFLHHHDLGEPLALIPETLSLVVK